MSLAYAPSGTAGSVGRVSFSGQTYNDPGSQAYVSQNPDRIDSKFFLEPVQSNLLGLWQAGGGLAGYQYSNVTFSCLAGLNVGDPVRVSASDTVVLATADTTPNSRLIGFVAEKPTSTTCLLSAFYKGVGVGLTAGNDVFLTDAGGFAEVAGTVSVRVGQVIDATTFWASALPQGAISGYSGFSGNSGWSGFSGTIGSSGQSGCSGASGFTGISGASGTSGFSGTWSGASGESGTSGFSGTYSGYSGESGFSGVSPTISYMAVGNAIKSSDEGRTSTSLADDADLQLSLGASTTYKIKAFLNVLPYSNGAQNYKFKITFSGTTSSSQFMSVSMDSNAYGYGYCGGMSGGGPVAIGTEWYQSTGAGLDYQVIVISGFVTTTTQGTLVLQWASASGDNQIIYAGSSIESMATGSGAVSFSGFSGLDGTSGTSGTSGYSGFSGAFSGMSGSSGESGCSGNSGTSGSSGTSGTSGHSGTSGRSGGSGISGYSGQSGASGFSGIGRSGYSGVEGTSGFSGASTSGYSGFDGESGLSGTSGRSGYSGFSGTSGAVGASGASGATGAIGTSGKSGVSGTAGAVGSSGTSGFSGRSGYSGIEGESGTSGFSGHSGKSGESGQSGLSGSSGTSGASGFSGTFSGESGFSGSEGPRGISGTSGYSGAWGGIDTVQYVLDGGEYPISNGIKGTLWFDYAFEILDWIVLADQEGDIELDVWRTTYAGFPPNATNSICGTNNPTIVNAQKARAVNVAGWTTSIAAGSALTIYVVQCSAITRATLVLKIRRS